MPRYYHGSCRAKNHNNRGGGETCKNTWLWQVNKQTFWLSSKIRKCYQQSGKRTFFLNDIWTKPSIEIFRRQDKNKTGKSDVWKFFWSRDIWHSEISECMWRFRKNKEEKLVFRQQHLMKYHQLSMYKPKENKTNEISKMKIYTLDISCILRKEWYFGSCRLSKYEYFL